MHFILGLQIPFVTKCLIKSQCKQMAGKCGDGQCVVWQRERPRGRGTPSHFPEI